MAWLLPTPGPLLLQDKLVRTVVANYILWPAAHLVNFRFVPSEQRILFNNCVSVSVQLLQRFWEVPGPPRSDC